MHTNRWLGTCKTCKTTQVREGDYVTCSIIRCTCGATIRMSEVIAEHSSKACDSRCVNAKRSACDCSCDGANHGQGHAA